jgi:hypothetical protein
MCVMKEKESVFRFFSKEKHFPLLKLCFLCWPEFSFRWLFSYSAAKHGKTRKVNSRNSLSCNQTRPYTQIKFIIFIFSMIIMILIWSIFFWFFIVFLGHFIKVYIVFNFILQIKFMIFIFSIIVIIKIIILSMKIIIKGHLCFDFVLFFFL